MNLVYDQLLLLLLSLYLPLISPYFQISYFWSYVAWESVLQNLLNYLQIDLWIIVGIHSYLFCSFLLGAVEIMLCILSPLTFLTFLALFIFFSPPFIRFYFYDLFFFLDFPLKHNYVKVSLIKKKQKKEEDGVRERQREWKIKRQKQQWETVWDFLVPF